MPDYCLTKKEAEESFESSVKVNYVRQPERLFQFLMMIGKIGCVNYEVADEDVCRVGKSIGVSFRRVIF
jgi:hypothetical protein